MYMGLTSLQVCMDSSDWLQGTIHEDNGMDSSSPSGDMLTCSRPLMERRLRPQHDQALKCPRCDSTHTKFCYYNNYSLSQPRYFCKTCRRYWTKGGTLRNIPVGGGCRKNKKSSNSKKPSNDQLTPGSSSSHNPTDLQLSFPEVQLSHLTNFLGNNGGGIGNFGFMDPMTRPIDFMESSSRNQDFGDHMGMMGHHELGPSNNFHALCSPPFGMSLDGNNNYGNTGAFMENCQRLMLPYEVNEDQNAMLDVKPNSKLLSLEWTDQGCSDAGKDYPFGYINSLGSWSGLINGCGTSTSTNPLV